MAKKLYVGNLTYNVNESDLEALFSQFGTVQSAQIIIDRDTNRSKGFGFVEMGSDAEAQAAILSGESNASRKAVTELADLEPVERKQAAEGLLSKEPRPARIKARAMIMLPTAPKELAKTLVDKLGREIAGEVHQALGEALEVQMT